MIDPSKLWIGALALCACACSGDDSDAPASEDGGGAGGGGAGGVMVDAGAGGSAGSSGGAGGAGGNAGGPPTGGMSAMTDAMVEDAADDSGPSGDAGAPRPFQSIAWPTGDAVVEIDAMSAFGTDVSGITYAPGTLWLSMNLSPSKLYKMEKTGATWRRVTSDGWGSGKDLLFPDGIGVPDAEGVTLAGSDDGVMYIASERNLHGGGAGQSRASVLRYNTAGAALALTAQQEWNLTASLPDVGANQGLEAATWIPDSQLDFFFDPATDERYDPTAYASHGEGLFVVGLESQSDLYFFALGSDGSVDLIATIATELDGVMGLEYDRSTGYLWAYCDDTCGNHAEILSRLPSGEFARRAVVAPPATLPNINNEGIAIAPDSECEGGTKPFYWVEDGNTNAHVLRAGTILCGAFLETL